MVKITALSNGLTLLVEEMPHVESCAYEVLMPGGVVLDAPETVGASLILSELTTRGAGSLPSQALSEAFDDQGIRHAESAGLDNFAYRGSLLSERLEPALRLVSLMIKEPMLPASEIDNIRSVLLQEIASIQDNPARRCVVELTKRYFPELWNRPTHGVEGGIARTEASHLEQGWKSLFRPNNALLSVAGKVKASEVERIVEKYFGNWSGKGPNLPPFGAMPERGAHHIQFESAQLQVALAYPSASVGHPHYYNAKVAANILSGGMHGRLFVEVREKRGLCYSVYARHSATQHYGSILAYAGTTPQRAHETLEVMVQELKGLKGTVSEEELKRAKANLKTTLILAEESSASRASSNAGDYWVQKRVRTPQEIEGEINKVTAASIDKYLEEFPVRDFMLLTLGARDLRDLWRKL